MPPPCEICLCLKNKGEAWGPSSGSANVIIKLIAMCIAIYHTESSYSFYGGSLTCLTPNFHVVGRELFDDITISSKE